MSSPGTNTDKPAAPPAALPAAPPASGEDLVQVSFTGQDLAKFQKLFELGAAVERGEYVAMADVVKVVERAERLSEELQRALDLIGSGHAKHDREVGVGRTAQMAEALRRLPRATRAARA